ncbi:response regulator transcription factor [Burkholderia sp. L27(2015)]|jgi:DNA-binding NarL/FixJ family response regulator|uniref:response regulator n=1 Tax=Burkholderia sp. L27(2015) TaxID=1641858 RepID=UPI00131B9CCB|nr:response regulator transcription factor [Burkholderia sp. L27(2015)]
MIRVLIADDHALVRDGLRYLLTKAGQFEIAGDAADGPSIIALARVQSADVLILDLSMPGRNGLDIIKQLRDEHPHLKILVLTMHAEQQYAKRAFAAGASGYMTKEAAREELVAAVARIAGGGIYVSVPMAERLARDLSSPVAAQPHERLSDREFDVLRRLVEGHSVNNIALQLSISAKTVSTYKARILEKMQMQSDAMLVRYAVQHKLFDEGDIP